MYELVVVHLYSEVGQEKSRLLILGNKFDLGLPLSVDINILEDIMFE